MSLDPALVWTLVALLGAIVSLIGVADGLGDLRALHGEANGRRRLARGYLRGETIRLFIQLSWVSVGGLALLDDRPGMWSLGAVVVIAGVAGLMLNSILDRLDRRFVRRYLQRADSRPETIIEQEDREIGDERRRKQVEHGTAPGASDD